MIAFLNNPETVVRAVVGNTLWLVFVGLIVLGSGWCFRQLAKGETPNAPLIVALTGVLWLVFAAVVWWAAQVNLVFGLIGLGIVVLSVLRAFSELRPRRRFQR